METIAARTDEDLAQDIPAQAIHVGIDQSERGQRTFILAPKL